MTRKILITAALPYANGPAHLGHFRSTYLPPNTFARYCKLKGYETLYVCATDEHGTPIEVKALQHGLRPEEFTLQWHERWAADFEKARVQPDIFYSTNSPENKELTTLLYQRLKEKGYFYKKTVKQTYCEKDGRFLPDRFVKGACPHCNAPDQYGDSCEACGRAYTPGELINPHCSICGQKPVVREVEHVFFKLSAFTSFLREWLQGTPGLPKDVTAYVLGWVKQGLQDWDLTRDGPYYGFEIPGEPGKYFYVWFDAPIGYIASTQAWAQQHGRNWEEWWSPESEAEIIHFIGKDIVYHHFLFWPSMLKGAGVKLPARIPVRGYLNLEEAKMSKSRGTLIEVSEFLQKYPADFLRYYLTSVTPNNVSDGSFSWKEFRAKINNEFLDAFGNYVYRVLSFLERRFGGTIPELGALEPIDEEFRKKLEAFAGELEPSYESLEFKSALEKWLAFAGTCNQYFSAREPWKMEKQKEGSSATVMHLAAKAVYALALASLPVTPDAGEKVIAQLNLAEAPCRWGDYSAFKAGLKLGKIEIIYPKLEEEEAVPEHPKEPGKKMI